MAASFVSISCFERAIILSVWANVFTVLTVRVRCFVLAEHLEIAGFDLILDIAQGADRGYHCGTFAFDYLSVYVLGRPGYFRCLLR